MATARAPNPREAVTEQAAVHIAVELSFGEARIAFAMEPAGLGEEGLEVLADDGVQNGLLGLAAVVAMRQRCGGRIGTALIGDRGQRAIERPRGGLGRRRGGRRRWGCARRLRHAPWE